MSWTTDASTNIAGSGQSPGDISGANCPRCGRAWLSGELACPVCQTLRHRQRLEQFAHQASQAEAVNPLVAMLMWRQCLELLPPQSAQYQFVQQRVAALSAGMRPPPMSAGAAPVAPAGPYAGPYQPPYLAVPAAPHALNYAAPPQHARQPWYISTAKTLASMLVSIVVYLLIFNGSWAISTGFVVLMLVHEMGHVIALRHYGLRASPPIFIPFLGAVIQLRQQPPNALAEAVVGIGGPVLGSLGALVCYGIFLAWPSDALLLVAYLGFFLNLFNLTPVPPLDGGRVTAAISPWVWVLGLIMLAGQFVYDFVRFHTFNYIMVLVLIYAAPRAWATLVGGQRHGAYYRISRKSSWTMAAVYGLLAIALWLMTLVARRQMAMRNIAFF